MYIFELLGFPDRKKIVRKQVKRLLFHIFPSVVFTPVSYFNGSVCNIEEIERIQKMLQKEIHRRIFVFKRCFMLLPF